MTNVNTDRRAIGGCRVIAPFSMSLPKKNPFMEVNDKLHGTLIFNVRGGCVFIKNGIKINAKSRIFTQGRTSRIESLEFTGSEEIATEISDLKIVLLGEKQKGSDCGVVFKFLQLTEEQLEKLRTLLDKFPTVNSDSVGFSEQRYVA